MQNWKQKVGAITKQYFAYDKKSTLNAWLIAVGDCLKDDLYRIPEGSSMKIPAENGDILSLEIHNRSLVVVQYSHDSPAATTLVTPRQYEKKELIMLKNYGDRLKADRKGLGFPYPNALKNKFLSLRPDEVVTFDNGMSFLCADAGNGFITLRKICGDILGEATLTGLFSVNRIFDMELDDTGIQYLYSKAKAGTSDSMEGRVSSVLKAQTAVKTIEQQFNTTKSGEKRIDLGPVAIILKKAMFSPAKWYSTDNEVLSAAQVANAFIWMATAPVIMDYTRKEPSLEKEYNDSLFDESLEVFFSEGKFDEVCSMLALYCLKNPDLEIVIKSYIRHNDDYVAAGFSFTSMDNSVVIRRLRFEDNDIKNRYDQLKSVPQSVFIEFCKEKFNSDYFLIQNKKKQVLMKDMPGLAD